MIGWLPHEFYQNTKFCIFTVSSQSLALLCFVLHISSTYSEQWIYTSWLDNAAFLIVKQTICSHAPFFLVFYLVTLTLSHTIHYLSQSSVLQMVSGLGQIRALQTIRREMDSWTICVNWEIVRVMTVALERGQTMPGCRRRKSHCSTWDKHNFILMNNWESLELGWDVCVWLLDVSVSW